MLENLKKLTFTKLNILFQDDAETISENSGPKTWASLFRSEPSSGINTRENRQSQFHNDSSEKLAISSQTKIEASKGVALNGGIGRKESKIANFLQVGGIETIFF